MTTPTNQKRKRSYHHGDLRQALLESALALLDEVGVQGLSLRAVAAGAGVSHAAPYRHFEDKESLIAAVAQDGFQRMFAHMSDARDAAPPHAKAQLLALGEAYVNFAKAHPTHFRLMFGPHMAHEERHPCAREAGWRCLAQLVEVVRSGQARGELAPGDTESLAVGYWSLVQGLATLEINGLLNRLPDAHAPDTGPLIKGVLASFTTRSL